MVRSFLFVFVLALGVVLSLGAARFAFAQEDPVVLFEVAREHHKAWRLDEAKGSVSSGGSAFLKRLMLRVTLLRRIIFLVILRYYTTILMKQSRIIERR